MALSDIERKEVFYKLRGADKIARPRKTPVKAVSRPVETPEAPEQPIMCPDVDKPEIEPIKFDVRIVPEEEFRSMPYSICNTHRSTPNSA